MFALDLKQNIL